MNPDLYYFLIGFACLVIGIVLSSVTNKRVRNFWAYEIFQLFSFIILMFGFLSLIELDYHLASLKHYVEAVIVFVILGVDVRFLVFTSKLFIKRSVDERCRRAYEKEGIIEVGKEEGG